MSWRGRFVAAFGNTAARAMRRPSALAGVLFALVAAIGPASGAPPVDRYNRVIRAVRELSGSPSVRLLPFGETYSGHSVPAYVISDFSTPPAGKTRVFVCSGQHGDEFIAVQSVLALSRSLASGAEPQLLKKCIFVVAPMINPDGVNLSRRLNNESQDLNRDWRELDSRETRHIDGLIRTWRPHILIDAHEQTATVSAGGSLIETPHYLTPEQQLLADALAVRVSANAGLRIVKCSPSSDKRLFHRNYACMGYGAFLLETSIGQSAYAKNREYSQAILCLARAVSSNTQARLALSPSASGFGVAAVASYLKPAPRVGVRAFAQVFYGFMLVAVAYGLCLWVIRPFSRERRAQWSRRFVRCEIDESLCVDALIHKHIPAPITYRSWTNRRLRARYLTPLPESKPDEPQPESAPQGVAVFIRPRYARQQPNPIQVDSSTLHY